MNAKMATENLSAFFGKQKILKEISLPILEKRVTALIGPSGCGKSTYIRCLNRMHEVVPGARIEGNVTLDGQDVYARAMDPVALRRRVGMVFQRPNPFPTLNIRDNVLAGWKLAGLKPDHPEDLLERSLRQAAL
ncbi:MAG: ATP-binding cassette domain-containing protein, partial [Firmicutes bacterium]|nr:ATP-binding cassette domain-containing protein [Bacillota bacterium]